MFSWPALSGRRSAKTADVFTLNAYLDRESGRIVEVRVTEGQVREITRSMSAWLIAKDHQGKGSDK